MIPEQRSEYVFFEQTFLYVAKWFLPAYFRLTSNCCSRKKAIRILNDKLVNDYFKQYDSSKLKFKECSNLSGVNLFKIQIENYNLWYHAANNGVIGKITRPIDPRDARIAEHVDNWMASMNQVVADLTNRRSSLIREFVDLNGIVWGEVWENTLNYNQKEIKRAFWTPWKRRQRTSDINYV